MKKIIFHIDNDSYFASVHMANDPSLRKKPIAISTNERRAVVSAANYEAKKLGISAAMPVYRAKKFVPNLVIVKPNFNLYVVTSAKLFEFLANTYTKQIEVASIDECFLDITDIWKKYGSIKNLAKDIQENIKKQFKLSVSIGISSNKFVAKMSTAENKPYGITITKPGDFLKVFGNRGFDKYYGIGQATALKLNSIGINTINDLAKADIKMVEDAVGTVGKKLIVQANGEGDDEINTEHNELKGIGNSITFMDSDRSSRQDILLTLKDLVRKVSHRAQKRNMVGYVVSVSIKEALKGKTKAKSKQITLKTPINSVDDILRNAILLFDELWKEETIKYVGVHLGKVVNMFETTYQSSIFDIDRDVNKIDKIIKDVNKIFKDKVVTSGTEIKQNNIKKQNQSRYIESDLIIKHMDD